MATGEPLSATSLGMVLRDPFELTARPPAIGRVVTATITLVCVLIIYDGWAKLRVLDVVLIILGPILAIFVSRVLDHARAAGPARTATEPARVARERPLRVAIPCSSRCRRWRFFLLTLATVSLEHSVRVVIWMETLSLAFWTGLAAWVVGMRGRPLVLAVLAGLVVSSVVLALQVMLQPGRALENGTAVGDQSSAS